MCTLYVQVGPVITPPGNLPPDDGKRRSDLTIFGPQLYIRWPYIRIPVIPRAIPGARARPPPRMRTPS